MLKKHFLHERVCHYIKEEWLNVRRTNIRGKKYSGNKSCIGICLNSFFLSIPYILDIYARKHKGLWNINGINYIGIPFIVHSQKSLDFAHGIDRKAELKKKKRTRKDTENVKCLILWDSLWIYIRPKIRMSRFHSQGFLSLLSCAIRQKKPWQIGCQYL